MRDSATLNTIDRPGGLPYKGRSEQAPISAAAASAATATIIRREQLFAQIRLARHVSTIDVDGTGALVALPAAVVVGSDVHDLQLSVRSGFFTDGVHRVDASGTIGDLEISGSFEIAVGASVEPAPACWVGRHCDSGIPAAIPPSILTQLPVSVTAPRSTTVIGSVRRAHLAAEAARRELIESNRGLIMSVVNRYRGVVRAESSALDMSDLIIVGEHQLLNVVDRYFSNPDVAPERHVAWSKLVQRAIGNAVRTEISRATGVSVEFRQLLTWMQTHPEDRAADPAIVAQQMAFAAGVTRLMAKRNIRDRFAGVAALELMLIAGEAAYVAPGKGANLRARELAGAGIFVISSRSSLAEIERAQEHGASSIVRLDADPDGGDRSSHLASSDDGYDESDWLDVVKHIIEDAGMTKVEALVWLHRSGALDPGGFGTELPDIAADLGLEGRSEARAALRRARRKLDAWAGDRSDLALVS
jgi:hypothetical protein